MSIRKIYSGLLLLPFISSFGLAEFLSVEPDNMPDWVTRGGKNEIKMWTGASTSEKLTFSIPAGTSTLRLQIKVESSSEGISSLLEWGNLFLGFEKVEGALGLLVKHEETDGWLPTDYSVYQDYTDTLYLDLVRTTSNGVQYISILVDGLVIYEAELPMKAGNFNFLYLSKSDAFDLTVEEVEYARIPPSFAIRAMSRLGLNRGKIKETFDIYESAFGKISGPLYMNDQERLQADFTLLNTVYRPGDLSFSEEVWLLTRTVNRSYYNTGAGFSILDASLLEASFEHYASDFLPSLASRSFRAPYQAENIGDYFAQKMTGYIIPEVSGEYVFWVAGDEQGSFALTDTNLENLSTLAYFDAAVGHQQYHVIPEQKSFPVYLEAGEVYYFEAWHADIAGDDSFSVAWTLPGEDQSTPTEAIPVSVITSYTAGIPGTTPRNIVIPDKEFLLEMTSPESLPQNFVEQTSISSVNSNWITANDIIKYSDYISGGTTRLHAYDEISGSNSNGLGWLWADSDDWGGAGLSMFANRSEGTTSDDGWVWYQSSTANPQYFFNFDNNLWYAFYPNPNRWEISNPIPFKYDWESGQLDGWAHEAMASGIEWAFNSGGTGSGNTGPSLDNTLKSATGTYLYMEASANSGGPDIDAYDPGDEVSVVSPTYFFSSGNLKVHFYYHMRGADMGTLRLDILKDGTWINNVWSISGEQHSGSTLPYNRADITLHSTYQNKPLKFRLRGTAAGGYRGDMAIDDFIIYIEDADTDSDGLSDGYELLNDLDPYVKNGLPIKYDWESGQLDGWIHEAMPSGIEWSFDNGGTGSGGTGPALDNTYRTSTGTYLYMEATENSGGLDIDAYDLNDEVSIVSPKFYFESGTLKFCLYFHMYGIETGTLRVDVQKEGVWELDKWTITGQQHTSPDAQYTRADVALGSSYAQKTLKFRVRATAAGGYRGDIAFDDLMLYIEGADSDGDGLTDEDEMIIYRSDPQDPYNSANSNPAGDLVIF